MSGLSRTILHVDMDAFFVSVELLDRPDLTDQPVAVGGAGPRGVIAAANYVARSYGVHSAMPSAQAQRKCPHLVILPGRFHRYAEVSARIMDLFSARTPLVEPISLDEAFLDVTGARRLLGDGRRIAEQLRADVYRNEGLWCSVGIASTKFVAKLASQQAKPRPTHTGGQARPPGTRPVSAPTSVAPASGSAPSGILEVPDDAVTTFLHPLDVSELWGVGPVTLGRLHSRGVATVGDLAATNPAVLTTLLGRSAGQHLHELANGVDPRAVQPNRAAKSIGHEQTYSRDLQSPAEVERELLRLSDAVSSRLVAAGASAGTVTVKVRFADFRTVSRSVTPTKPVQATADLAPLARTLAKSVGIGDGIRLLGVSGSGLVSAGRSRQLSFDDLGVGQVSATEVQHTVEAIRRRWGSGAIGPAALMDREGLALRRRGDDPWGPGSPPPENPST